MTISDNCLIDLREKLGLTVFTRICKYSVAVKRRLQKKSKEEINAMMKKARSHITEETYANRTYTKEGLASLRLHVKKVINRPEHYLTRNADFYTDPEYIKFHSDKAKKQHALGTIKTLIIEKHETNRINDHCGVLTMEDMANL